MLWPFTLAQVVYYSGFAASYSLLVLLVTDELSGSSIAFGLILATGAIGAFVGSLVGSRVAAALGARSALAAAVALQGLTVIAAAAAHTPLLLGAIWFLNGIPAGVQRPIARSQQQRLTPNRMLGRVNVSARVLTRGVIVGGSLTAGSLAAITTVRWSFVAGGLVQLLAAGMTWDALRGAAAAARS